MLLSSLAVIWAKSCSQVAKFSAPSCAFTLCVCVRLGQQAEEENSGYNTGPERQSSGRSSFKEDGYK